MAIHSYKEDITLPVTVLRLSSARIRTRRHNIPSNTLSITHIYSNSNIKLNNSLIDKLLCHLWCIILLCNSIIKSRTAEDIKPT